MLGQQTGASNRDDNRQSQASLITEFMQPALETGSAFVAWIGGDLDDLLCEQFERTVRNDNCVLFDGLVLQIPADRQRCHYVKVKVRVLRYSNGAMAIFHGPRKLACYDALGLLDAPLKAAA